MSLRTPIAFIIFNRPGVTERVFARIRQAHPEKLFIIADGPRADHSEDVEKCAAAQRVLKDGVDWPCEVNRDFAENNLGCKKRVSSGLDWVFSQVEEAIILEDDCLPDPSFFPYCEELLARYRDEPRIMHIGGTNFQRWRKRTFYSYYFSKYNHVWGWATWRRAWEKYDRDLHSWRNGPCRAIIEESFDSERERKYWIKIFDQIGNAPGSIDSWDFSWTYSCWAQRGLSICPVINLVENIGIGEDSTHTGTAASKLRITARELHSLRHPSLISRHRAADRFTFRICYALEETSFYKRCFYFLKIWGGKTRNRLKHILSLSYDKLVLIPFKLLKFLYHTSPAGVIKRLKGQFRPANTTSGLPRWVTIENGPMMGRSMLLAPERFAGWEEMIKGNYDCCFLEHKWVQSKSKGSIIWDIGAHFGYTAMSFAEMCGEKGKVFAFEPNPFNVERFEENLKKNSDLSSRIEILPYGLSESDGEEKFKFSPDIDGSQSSGSHLESVTPPLSERVYADFQVSTVEIRKIDSLLQKGEILPPAIVKIDVEGAEMAVLSGGIQVLKKYKPLLLIEIHHVKAMLHVSNILRDTGYRIEVLDEADDEPSRCFIIGIPSENKAIKET